MNGVLGLLIKNGLKPSDSYDKALQIMSSIDADELKKVSDGFGGYDMSDVISYCRDHKEEITNIGKNNDLMPLLCLLIMAFGGFSNNNDSYYRGKADAYERILGDLLEENVSKPTN